MKTWSQLTYVTVLCLAAALPATELRADSFATPPPATAPIASALSTGPWGTLRVSPIRLTVPDRVLRPFAFAPAGDWTFSGERWTDIEAFIRAAPVTADQLRVLLDPERRTVDPDTHDIVLKVPDATRLELSPEARKYLYRRLARYEANVPHYLPYIISSDAVIEQARLNPELRARLKQLEFTRGDRRSLTDADLLTELTRDEEELSRLKRMFYTYPALSVELTRASIVEPDAAIAYWARPDKAPGTDWAKRFQRSPDIESIDLAGLLPPLPRSLLNSFPDGISCPHDANCFWISINFFRKTTNDRVLPYQFDEDESRPAMMEELRNHYDPVKPPYRFGDIIAIFEIDGLAYSLSHTMVYLADDIVFTKNGSGQLSPFQLSRLDRVIELYDWAFELRVQGFRPRTDSTIRPALPR